MASADGERLARRTPGNQIHFVLELGKIKLSNVDFVQRPAQVPVSWPRKVEPHSRARIEVPFNDQRMIKSRFLHAHSKSPRPGK
jgi:hypothetical protein